jgi:hypothetical protein
MSTFLLSAWRSLISLEGVCTLAPVIALAMIAKLNSLRQLLYNGRGHFIKPSSACISDAKSDSNPRPQFKRLLEDSNPRIFPSTGVISTNWVIMALKAAALLALLSLGTLCLSIVSRGFYGQFLYPI